MSFHGSDQIVVTDEREKQEKQTRQPRAKYRLRTPPQREGKTNTLVPAAPLAQNFVAHSSQTASGTLCSEALSQSHILTACPPVSLSCRPYHSLTFSLLALPFR